ncbi:MAG: hypothetical protein EAZ08_02890 [Cytophagales bacterium]|nr:MAG: hypothetical protein EAZ08_02890 [Cytophagales bacterium]
MITQNNIPQVSNSSSFYRETQNDYLPNPVYGNHYSFFHSGGIMNNIAYEAHSPVSVFAKTLDQAYINIISFQQFIQKQIIYLETANSLSGRSPSVATAKTLLKEFCDLFIHFFAPHYQAPKIIFHIEKDEITFELTLSPQTKVFIAIVEENITLAYRYGKELKKIAVSPLNVLENLSDLFSQYGTQHDLAQNSSAFR